VGADGGALGGVVEGGFMAWVGVLGMGVFFLLMVRA
jgi:hypothetical protein